MRLSRLALAILPLLAIAGARASPPGPINVLVMHWYNRGYPTNETFDERLERALNAAAPGGVTFYSEYLETNRFPGDHQARILSEYLRQKYAGKRLDVIISGVSETLDFLLKQRQELFPGVPIVFAMERPVSRAVRSASRAAGFTYANTFAKTLDLALQWHPGTKQLFVVSGTLEHDKALESIVRDELRQHERALAITYLTDLPPDELAARISALPKNSLILYVWQQVLDAQGRLLEAQEVLARVVRAAKVPIYGRSYAMIGRGIIGGYVWTQEGNAAKLAEITMRVVNGTPPEEIPLEKGPETPMFDWRQLQRWGIGEDRLPQGSIVRFREPGMWEQYKWRIVGAIGVVVLQAILIGSLLILRQRAQRRAVALAEVQRVVQESEERFRRVFEEGPLGLALFGKDYRFLKVNNALCQMVGYGEAELVRMSVLNITHPDDVRADVELAEQLFKREIPFYRIQKRYLTKSGEFIWINLSASILHRADGEPLHGLAMVEDITEIKRTQEEALLRQHLVSLGTLAGGIAHDFNNLLGAIQAQAELAAVEADAGLSCREELKVIGEVATRGSEIVRQLMVYAGKESAALGPVDLSRIVEEMLSLLKVSITKHAVIKTDLDPNLPAIFASAVQVRQVVMNLITNASDAIGDKDGVIQVITRRMPVNGESVSVSSNTPPDGHYVELEVSDTGRGIPPQTQAKVFDPFFTTKSAGRGLGLAIVQGIVQSLNGIISLASEAGKGTSFRILLPCMATAAYASERPISADGNSAGASAQSAILVVEDEDSLRRPVVKMLQKAGYEVFEAADGNAAMNLLHVHGARIDRVLLDMTIPGTPSHEIVAEVTKLMPRTRVILTSAYSQEMIEGSMSAPQICGFIRKPFQFADLLNAIRSSFG
jgi:PAS domain S-box-containing protein